MDRGHSGPSGGERMPLVLVIDADHDTREECEAALQPDFSVIAERRPVAVVMNVRTPGMDGEELIRVLRAACDVPIIALASGSRPEMTARALDSGADCVMEGAAIRTELAARLRAVIRRYERHRPVDDAGPVIRTGALVIDMEAQTLRKSGMLISLTPTERRLLYALASRLDEVAPQRYLLSAAWGDSYVDDTQYLRTYIGYLRQKLEDDPAHPTYVLNVWGVGYRLASLPYMGVGSGHGEVSVQQQAIPVGVAAGAP
jgi:two-component system, OmpR family, KDP operon response regulator KdpE